jgi:hypothetical protein
MACVVGCTLLLCVTGYGRSGSMGEKVKLTLSRASLSKLLDALDEQSGYSFSYIREDFDRIIVKEYTVTDISLWEALKLLKKKAGIEFAVNGNSLIFRKAADAIQKKAVQTGKLTGKIIEEESGEPVVGATITISDQVMISDAAGVFSCTLPVGQYEAVVSFIGYGIKQVTDIIVKHNETFTVNVTLKRQKGTLGNLLVRSSAKRETVNALLVHQKNASEITNGISAEQISRTPDRHIGESLKRISGVSTNDNKFVVIRGIGERYNAVTLDGTLLPSTEAQSRNFSFDLIPSNLVDNVIVSKTVTPDMNVSFGGGLVQINTKDLPAENFMTISGGVSYNDQTTGKDFYSRKRGKYDFLGFDDGHRGDYPENLRATEPMFYGGKVPFNVYEQARQFKNNDNFSTYRNTAIPSQNYQLTIGRQIRIDSTGKNKLGFTGSLSYRNTLNTSEHTGLRRGSWHYAADSINNNHGQTYGYNVAWGALLNIGWQSGTNRFSFRNTYTHMFDNPLVRTYGYNNDASIDKTSIPDLLQTDDPTFLDLLQNKLSGQHQLHKVKIEWNLARAAVKRDEKDVIYTLSKPVLIGKEIVYLNVPGSSTEPKDIPMSRSVYRNKESHYSGNVSVSVPFQLGSSSHTFKTGYAVSLKKSNFRWQAAAFTVDGRYFNYNSELRYLPVGEWGNHIADSTGYTYTFSPWALDYYEGKSQSHAGFAMFDSRLHSKLRLVWGLRAEYYEYTEINNPTNTRMDNYMPATDKPWQLMPSANLTYSPLKQLNLRAAWSNSTVRPELMDNSRFKRYSPYYDGDLTNAGVSSTRITSYDVKAEWFPGTGDVLSAGAFYKYFDKPVEMVVNVRTGNLAYVLQNSSWAKVYGIELEARKNLRFIADRDWLENIVLYSNLTLQKSNVESQYTMNSNGQPLTVIYREKRALYGQVPFLLNAAALYSGKHLGATISYNKAGYKTNLVSDQPHLMEREMPREQLDAQLSYKLPGGKMECKLNMGNLLNAPFRFYRNEQNSVVEKPGFDPVTAPKPIEWGDQYEYKPGFSDKYEEGDLRTFTRYIGRTFSVAVSYNF